MVLDDRRTSKALEICLHSVIPSPGEGPEKEMFKLSHQLSSLDQYFVNMEGADPRHLQRPVVTFF